jgi:hypothetical protein
MEVTLPGFGMIDDQIKIRVPALIAGYTLKKMEC